MALTKTKKMKRNQGTDFDENWLEQVTVNLAAVLRRCEQIVSRRCVKKQWQAAWLLKAVTCLDLTTLSGSDTSSNVERLCFKAYHPVRSDILSQLNVDTKDIHVGAVCVYPALVKTAVETLENMGASHIPVASVSTGFPTGQYSLKTRLAQIHDAVSDGAKEIDIVIRRPLVLNGNWRELYQELKLMREACGEAHMKTILAIGELGTLTNVYKASLVAMMAGSDFIKTSTGKEDVNAILPVGLVMARAIRDYFVQTNFKVGFKPAGGIRTAKDVLQWLILLKEELGNDWLNSDLFRIGASGVLGDIERQLFHYATGRYASLNELTVV